LVFLKSLGENVFNRYLSKFKVGKFLFYSTCKNAIHVSSVLKSTIQQFDFVLHEKFSTSPRDGSGTRHPNVTTLDVVTLGCNPLECFSINVLKIPLA